MINPSRLLCTLGFSLSLISAAGAVGTGDTQIYGSYNLGCIANAQAFPLQGEHYVTQQWGPKRNYAAPQMIDYLTKLTARAKEAGLPPLIIGDLSAPRGGPYGKSNHASHMIGLDVDIPFGFAPDLPRTLTTPQSFYLVRNGRLTDSFDAERIKLIYLAAQDERVERIFVAPRIKEGMCKLYAHDPTNDKWLRRLRPWFGHREHMHVRLSCPPDSPYCVAQAATPAGNGCGEELRSWFLPPDPHAKPVKPKSKVKPQWPQQCKVLLHLAN